MRIDLLPQQLQVACQTSQQASVLAKRRGDFEGSSLPESQTLNVLSYDPDTILVPSEEKVTDEMQPLCASVFSLNSSRLSARQANKRQ